MNELAPGISWLKTYFKLKSPYTSLSRLHLLSQIEGWWSSCSSIPSGAWSQLRPINGKHFFPGAPFPAGGTFTRLCGVMLGMASMSLEAAMVTSSTTITTCLSTIARPIGGKRSAPTALFQAGGNYPPLYGVMLQMGSTCSFGGKDNCYFYIGYVINSNNNIHDFHDYDMHRRPSRQERQLSLLSTRSSVRVVCWKMDCGRDGVLHILFFFLVPL